MGLVVAERRGKKRNKVVKSNFIFVSEVRQYDCCVEGETKAHHLIALMAGCQDTYLNVDINVFQYVTPVGKTAVLTVIESTSLYFCSNPEKMHLLTYEITRLVHRVLKDAQNFAGAYGVNTTFTNI